MHLKQLDKLLLLDLEFLDSISEGTDLIRGARELLVDAERLLLGLLTALGGSSFVSETATHDAGCLNGAHCRQVKDL